MDPEEEINKPKKPKTRVHVHHNTINMNKYRLITGKLNTIELEPTEALLPPQPSRLKCAVYM